jgi:hypothetical protein
MRVSGFAMVLLVTMALSTIAPAAAHADRPRVGGAKVIPGGVERGISAGGEESSAAVPSQPVAKASTSDDDGKVWVGIPVLGSMDGEDGEARFCRRTRWVRVAPEQREEQTRRGETDFLSLFGGLPELQGHNPFLECPVDPTEAVPAVVLREAVTETIRDDLPRPTLEVPPGYALTGMPAYLVTNHQLEYGPVTHSVDLGVAVLDVTVTGSGVTQVDWGDGTSATYHAPGTPWPDGQVVHTYRDAQTVDITVTDTWQVTYRVPALGIEDAIEAPLPTRTLEGLEVQQVQAVRVSD